MLLRGKWVEVDRARLERVMARFREAETLAAKGGLDFAEAMRLLAGVDESEAAEVADQEWSQVRAGLWLEETLQTLRSSGSLTEDTPPGLRGTLRPYQKAGVQWLRLLSGLRLGACLADDMGLGKTIQVLALLLAEKSRRAVRQPSILVAPASLLANWSGEIDRFAPDLRARIVHSSTSSATEIKTFTAEDAAAFDLVITSYGTLLRLPALTEILWRFAILDEAQAIKNPAAKQTRAAKALRAEARIALTGRLKCTRPSRFQAGLSVCRYNCRSICLVSSSSISARSISDQSVRKMSWVRNSAPGIIGAVSTRVVSSASSGEGAEG